MVTPPLPWAVCAGPWPPITWWNFFSLNIPSTIWGCFLSSCHSFPGRSEWAPPGWNLLSGSFSEQEGPHWTSFSEQPAASATHYQICAPAPSPDLFTAETSKSQCEKLDPNSWFEPHTVFFLSTCVFWAHSLGMHFLHTFFKSLRDTRFIINIPSAAIVRH